MNFGTQGTTSASTSGATPAASQEKKAEPKAAPPPKAEKPKKEAVAKAEAEEEDKLVLQNAVHGQVVTRFPPEASGFIHIGHAKAALVNSMLRTKYGGKMILRFDDTNPEKEKEDFEHAILEDLQRLGITWDIGPTYSSDYFDLMLEKCDELLKKDLAYCDITDPEEMKKYRYDGIPTPSRSHSVAENLRIWDEMKRGTEFGKTACVRAKISIDDPNKALRDPTIYRTKVQAHPRTGTKYNVYPTYDFCVPIVDSVEGVTHALRTNEYHDRNAQYYWFIKAMNLRPVMLEDFSRLNMEYSLMSKRKLTKCVELGVVDGWDDPRFPTVRALLRRGLKVDALKEFVKVQGMSKAVNFMEWSKLWNFNVQILDPSVPRYTAVAADLKVHCKVEGASGLVAVQRLRHKKNEALGSKTFYQGSEIFLDAEDVLLLADNEEVTLMDWGNAFVKNVKKNEKGVPVSADITLHLEGDFKKTKNKLTWIAHNPQNVPLLLNEYDHLLTKKKPDDGDELDDMLAKYTLFRQKAIGEPALAEVKVGDTFQLERRGYYIVDKKLPDGTLSLIHIPDGKDKLNHLSAKAQFLKEHPDFAAVPEAGKGGPTAAAKPAPKGTKADDALTLEEKRALKAAKKAASGKKADDPK